MLWWCALWWSLTTNPRFSDVDVLQVDPLLVRQAEVVWQLIGREENPIWPGWNAADTPILIYLPGIQDLLIQSKTIPAGFVKYRGPVRFGESSMLIRNGKTEFDLDGQNTSKSLFGVPSLVVADTLSNRRNQLLGWMGAQREGEASELSLSYDSLRANPYDQMSLIAHEAFHVYQMSLPRPFAQESSLRSYPCLSPENNAGFAWEARELKRAIESRDDLKLLDAALSWLSIRLERRRGLDDSDIEYEDRNEFIEGTAKYVEIRAMEYLEGSEPPEALWLAQGFRGFDDMDFIRESALSQMVAFMSGAVAVNNDPYGTAPVRYRLYYSGLGIALLLDRLFPEWKEEIVASSLSLTELVQEILGATEEEQREKVEKIKGSSDYRECLLSKQELARLGEEDTKQRLSQIVSGERTRLVLDYSDLPDPDFGLTYTPFGIRRVDDDRVIYSMIPLKGSVGQSEYGFAQEAALPLLQDRRLRTFTMKLTRKVDQAALMLKLSSSDKGVIKDLQLELPGVRVTAARCRIVHRENEIEIQFLSRSPH